PRRRRRHALPDVLRPLRHAVHRPPRRLQHLPRTGDDLPRHQIRNQHVRQPTELPVPPHQIILMAPVGVPRRIRVVLEQENVPGDALLTEPPLRIDLETLQNPLTGLVMRHQIDDAVALRRRVLRMTANVQVQPRPIAKEHVAAATPRHHPPEQIPRHLVRRQPPLTPEGAGDAVLVLQPENAPVHTMTLCGKTPTWQSLDLTICRTGPRLPRPAHDRPATAGTAATAPPRRARTRPETGRPPGDRPRPARPPANPRPALAPADAEPRATGGTHSALGAVPGSASPGLRSVRRLRRTLRPRGLLALRQQITDPRRRQPLEQTVLPVAVQHRHL